jgi:hypothetical protein
MRRAARWAIGCGVPFAVWAGLYFPSHRQSPPDTRVELPPGDAVDQRSALCGEYVARDDLTYLLGDPTNLIETHLGNPQGRGNCRFFDGSQDRFVLKIEITSNDDPDFASQVKYSRTIPRGPRYYVVIFLRQGPMNFDKVKRILQMANKFSAALPQPTSGPRGTAPKKSSQK